MGMTFKLNRPLISAIVAKAKHNVIGKDGDMPWHMPSDLKYFQSKTKGKPVIMGRVTWESLPAPLKGRQNLILTRNSKYKADGAEVFTCPSKILNRAFEIANSTGAKEVMIIGGGQVYDLFLPYCDRVYITRIEADLEGDTKFPRVSIGPKWNLIESESLVKRPKDQFASERKVYEKKPSLFDGAIDEVIVQKKPFMKMAV